MRPRIVRFGTFQADLEAGELYRDGIRLKLGGQPFQVLEVLLSRPGDVVTREELRAALWQSDTFVDFDHGLNSIINRIREALGDSATNPRFVETIPRRGYRFIAPVEQAVAEGGPKADEPPVVEPPKRRRWWIGAVAGVMAVSAIGFALLHRVEPARPSGYKLRQLTRDTGLTYQPTISGGWQPGRLRIRPRDGEGPGHLGSARHGRKASAVDGDAGAGILSVHFRGRSEDGVPPWLLGGRAWDLCGSGAWGRSQDDSAIGP
ncbi:MAG: winged helix-turn-helix domain-containing protein [Bryobacteraceae bacterium]